MKQVKGMWSQLVQGTQGGSEKDANFKNFLEIKPVVKSQWDHNRTYKNGEKLYDKKARVFEDFSRVYKE